MYWFCDNTLRTYGLNLHIPANELLCTVAMTPRIVGASAFSPRYRLCDEDIPLWHGAQLSLKVNDVDGIDCSKLYIKRITGSGSAAVIGKYEYGWVTGNVDVIGCYELAMDTVPPRLVTKNENSWLRDGIVRFRLADGETYIKSFRGTLDGNFVLFEYSSKNSELSLDIAKENIGKGKHLLRVTATDALDNETVFEKELDIK
jgi:hypothetical protein